MKLLNEIFTKLGLTQDNGLIETKNENWTDNISFSDRIKRVISKKHLKPDALFCFDNKPLILFYLNPTDKKELHKAIWNFNESPVVFIIENNKVEIFNGYNYIIDNNSLDRIGGSEKLNDFKYFELVTGRTWEKYNDKLKYENRVDNKLLNNIKAAINELVKLGLGSDLANALIGKCIFTRYLIDRKVKIKFETKESELLEPDRFYDILEDKDKANKFFTYLEEQFNGNLFKIKIEDYSNFSDQHYLVLSKLLKGDEISTGQMSLFNIYNFEILPVEFISNVYESFIGKENQKTKGAYYTPLFLVDYILKETVETHLENNKDNYSCKILDPACGSGIFLVETLRKLIEKYNLVTNNKPSNADNYKQVLKDIVLENIFGIDDDQSAIDVAIFSIYLTLLDYQEPSEIETFKFPPLLNINFFKADFFNTELEYNEKLKNIKFDFIVGNPPWHRGKGEKEKPLYVKYIDKRRINEVNQDSPQIEIGNKEIAQAFLLRSSDFSNNTTKCGLIVTSKVLYNLQSIEFRKYFLHNYYINKVLELAPVRREVFNKSNTKAIAPACVLFFSFANGDKTDFNILDHIALKPSRFFSLFHIFTINRNDYKTIQQNKLKEFDWLWKVLVYGSYLDFNFIKRLKNENTSIEKEINDESRFKIGQGIMVGGGDENPTSHLVGLPFIDTKKDIKQYWVNTSSNIKWSNTVVHRPRSEELFEPMLLIKEGVSNNYKCCSAVCLSDSIFKSSLTAIKAFNKDDIKYLRIISAILNSSSFSYLALQTFSSIGIEREQSHDEEKWNVPLIENNNIAKLVSELESLYIKFYNQSDVLITPFLETNIQDKINELDSEINISFKLTTIEQTLINYTNDITIPILEKLKGYKSLFELVSFQSDYINEYAHVFLERFKHSLDNDVQKFIVEIQHTNQIIGMFFKVIPVSEYSEPIIWKDVKNESELLKTVIKLSSEKITDRLFIQKDIRGFEKDYFYIFKPNEKRLWHKAIAYLDVEEFADAILKAGRDSK